MYLVPFVLFFFYCYFSFLGGKVNFSLHVGGVMVSSSAGQTLTYVSILEVYISFEWRVQGSGCLAVSKNHLLLYIPQLYFY